MTESIPELESLMQSGVKGTIVQADYINGSFTLSFILPGERTVSFGDNVYTGRLALQIQADKDNQLMRKATLNVKVSTQPDPPRFGLGLKANMSGASACAQMLTDWVKPWDLGKQVTIRGCALEFGIVYATFFTIGLVGQISVGSKEAKVAMKLSQDPKEQLLAASIKDLGIVDLVKFASLIAEREFSKPDDFLHFNDIDLYISAGATIGLISYPPRVSLKGDMTIFGKRAKFEYSVGKRIKFMRTFKLLTSGLFQSKERLHQTPLSTLSCLRRSSVVASA
ncbi:MAG: hypothetical protein M1821_002484 [Bathelium mastoideum]|nr:MAG: hypothetical protein M1821_002484 [Bathelium mastoideum]